MMETSRSLDEICHHENKDLSSPLDSENFDAVESIGSKRVFNVVNVFYIDRLRQQKFAVPPFFKEHLQNVEYEEGKVLELRCRIRGCPRPEVEWYKEGERITEVNEGDEKIGDFIGYKYYATNENNDLSLVVTNVKEGDFGQYACKIRNAVGEARSTALVYPKSNSECTCLQKDKEDEKRKVIIEERITIVERKPLFTDAQSEFHQGFDTPTNEVEELNKKEDMDMQSNEQLMTVLFSVPKGCETKDLKIKISKGQVGEVFSDNEFDFKNRYPSIDSSQFVSNEDGGTTREEKLQSIDNDSFEEEELNFSPSSEREIHKRVSWIQRGELSDSEYRRNPIPQPLPRCLTESTDDSIQPNSSQTLLDDTTTSPGTESWQRRCEVDEDVSEGESKDTIRGDCGRLFSRNGVFTFAESAECVGDPGEFTDVFDDDHGISPRTEPHDVFSESGVATLHELSPLSPDSGGTGCKGFEQGAQQRDEPPDDGLQISLAVEDVVESSHVEDHQCAPPIADTDTYVSGPAKEETEQRVRDDLSKHHISSIVSPEHGYTSDEDNLKALDELIARLLEFSQRDYVLVSSLRVGRDTKRKSRYGPGHTLERYQEKVASSRSAVVGDIYSDTYKIQRMDIPMHPSDLSAESEDEMEHRKPKFVIPLEDMVIDSEESVVLNISVTGFPAPKISWFKDGLPLNEADTGEITDDLKCQSATYSCTAKNSSGEAVTSAVITVRPPGAEDAEIPNNDETPPQTGVKLRKRKAIVSEEKRWSQIISASLVDYLRSKAKSLELAEEQRLSKDVKEPVYRVSEQAGLARDDVTLRRGSMLSLNSLSTTSFESADETFTSSDAVWEEVASTCEEDFMSTDEFFFPGINENNLTKLRIPGQFCDTRDSDDDLFSPRPLTPTPVSEKPPFEYEVTVETSKRPFTRTPTDPCLLDEHGSSEDMETAPSNSVTPVPPDRDSEQVHHDVELRQPKFLVTLKDGEFLLGSTFVLTCCVFGKPEPMVTWHRNGIQILPTESNEASPRSFMQSLPPTEGDFGARLPRLQITSEERQDGTNGSETLRYTLHTLTIKDCRLTDVGEYSVIAFNTYGKTITKASILSKEKGENSSGEPTEFAMPQFLSKITDSDGMVEGQAVMNFELTGQPEPDVTIFHNREEAYGERYSLTREYNGKYTFTISDLRLEDEGEVRVCAMNVVGYAECASELFVDERMVTPTPDRLPQWSDLVDDIDFGVLDIREQLTSESTAPYFDDIVDDVIALPGSEAMFTVRVYAWPAPDVYWYKNDERVLNEGRFGIECTDFGTHVLKIQAINEVDAGIYTCVAKNSLGQVSCKAELLLGPTENLLNNSSDEEDSRESEKRRLRDDYVVCGNIRNGSFSVVRFVKHKETNDKYAAKYIRCNKAELKDKILKEVIILKKLSHDVIVEYKDYYESKKDIIIVMKHAGQEWFEFLLEKNDVTELEISNQVRSLCSGLQYLHENKVVHLDMKPENIMIVESRLKIIDFGSAKELKNGEDIFWDYGNPEFAPPEVVQSQPVTDASDMWSLGAIVFVVLSGNTPFLGDSDHATILQVCDGKFEFDSRWFGEVSDAAKDFIKRLLVVEMSSRLSSVEAQSHKWLHDNASETKTNVLSEGRLKYFCSRRKWQRSLVGPKSSLTVRSLPSLLKREYDSTSVAVSRSLTSDYTSSSTVTESEDDTDNITGDSAPTSPRSRFDTLRKFSQNASIERGQRRSKSSITIEDTIEMQKAFVFAPTVKVTESSPKASPKLNRKARTNTKTEDDYAEEKPSEDSDKKKKPPVKPLHLTPLYPKQRLKMLGKKVSFDDDPPNVTAVEEVQSPVFLTASEKMPSPPIIAEEIQLKDIPPVAQMPEVPVPPASSGPPGVSLDRPQSVSKLLKEDRKVLKSRRTIDADSRTSTKDKIKKKLSLKSLRRHRSLDTRSLSSSSDDEVATQSGRNSSKKENLGGKSKFSLFSRRKRPVTKGSSLDSTTGSPDEKKLDTTPDASEESSPKATAKSPIKGILKRGPSSDASSQSDPHLPKSLQKSHSPTSVSAANTESFTGPKRQRNKPFAKGMSLELDMVAEKSNSSSGKSSSSNRRRPQFRRVSSVESPAKLRQRVSGLRGPLMEKGAIDDEPIAGMSLRRSTPVLTQGSSPNHSRSYSGPLSLPSFAVETGRLSPTILLSPQMSPSSPYRKYSSLQRSFFSQSVDITRAQLPETVPQYGLNARKSQSQTAMLSTMGRPFPRSRSQDRPIGRRGRSADRRRSGESYAPYLKAPLVDQGLTYNQTYVTLSCIIDAFPQPEVLWHKGSEEITASNRIEIISEPSISRYQLKIRSTMLPNDFGQYTCEAKNSIGTVKTECKLVEAVPPGKPSAPEFSGTDGRNVWISWNPPMNCAPSPISYMLQYREMAAMKWVVVDDSIKDTLEKIENLRPTTSYRFRVRAVNNAGVGPFSKVSQRIQLDPTATVQSLKYAF